MISQRLIDSADATGRVLASEVMTGNNRIAVLILAGGEPAQFIETIQDAEFFGMQTFDQSLLTLVKERRITVPAALPHVRNTHDFRAKAMEAGVDA